MFCDIDLVNYSGLCSTIRCENLPSILPMCKYPCNCGRTGTRGVRQNVSVDQIHVGSEYSFWWLGRGEVLRLGMCDLRMNWVCNAQQWEYGLSWKLIWCARFSSLVDRLGYPLAFVDYGRQWIVPVTIMNEYRAKNAIFREAIWCANTPNWWVRVFIKLPLYAMGAKIAKCKY